MKWLLIVALFQGDSSWVPGVTQRIYPMPDQATCEQALKSGSFSISGGLANGEVGKGFAAFCAPDDERYHPKPKE